jgi:SAM-dependent methyltransferase
MTHGARAHQHDHPVDLHVLYTQEFWDERYGSADRVWSGDPNAQLVATVTDLPPVDASAPATALDLGCGEGADAIWLASRGWQVTAIDMSPVALARGATQAAAAGVADKITWMQADGLTWDPGSSRYDLVSAQFIHVPQPQLSLLHRGLASAVRPGGTLLIVGHHPSDLDTTIGRPNLPDLMFTAEQIATVLDPADWHIATSATAREAVDPDGNTITIRDAVLRATRRS